MKVYTKSIKNNSFYEVGTKKIFKNFPPILFWSIFFLLLLLLSNFMMMLKNFSLFFFSSIIVSRFLFLFFYFPLTLISIARLSLSLLHLLLPSLYHPQIMVVFLSLCVIFYFHRIFFILTAIKIIKRKY